jgi:hypothetical protein
VFVNGRVCKQWAESIANIAEEKGLETFNARLHKIHAIGLRTKEIIIDFGSGGGTLSVSKITSAENLQTLDITAGKFRNIQLIGTFNCLVSLKIQNVYYQHSDEDEIPFENLQKLQTLHLRQYPNAPLLSRLGPEIRELLLPSNIDLLSIARFHQLRSLTVTFGPSSKYILNCRQLECLDIRHAPIHFINTLASSLVSLKKLKVRHFRSYHDVNREEGVIDFQDFNNVEELYVDTHVRVKNIHCLKNIQILELSAELYRIDTSNFNFPHLRTFKINTLNPGTAINFNFLINSKNLRILSLKNVTFRIYGFDFIKYLTTLQCLELQSTVIDNLTGFESLTNLIHLSVSDCERITYLSPLQGMTKLKKLSLKNISNITDYSVLQNMPCLEYLSIDGSGLKQSYRNELCDADDLSPLASLTNLRTLRVTGLTYLTDVSCLQHLPNLSFISFDHLLMLKSIACLQQLPNLNHIQIRECIRLVNDFTEPLHFKCGVGKGCPKFEKSSGDIFYIDSYQQKMCLC